MYVSSNSPSQNHANGDLKKKDPNFTGPILADEITAKRFNVFPNKVCEPASLIGRVDSNPVPKQDSKLHTLYVNSNSPSQNHVNGDLKKKDPNFTGPILVDEITAKRFYVFPDKVCEPSSLIGRVDSNPVTGQGSKLRTLTEQEIFDIKKMSDKEFYEKIVNYNIDGSLSTSDYNDYLKFIFNDFLEDKSDKTNFFLFRKTTTEEINKFRIRENSENVVILCHYTGEDFLHYKITKNSETGMWTTYIDYQIRSHPNLFRLIEDTYLADIVFNIEKCLILDKNIPVAAACPGPNNSSELKSLEKIDLLKQQFLDSTVEEYDLKLKLQEQKIEQLKMEIEKNKQQDEFLRQSILFQSMSQSKRFQ